MLDQRSLTKPSLPPDSPDSPPTERCARYQVRNTRRANAILTGERSPVRTARTCARPPRSGCRFDQALLDTLLDTSAAVDNEARREGWKTSCHRSASRCGSWTCATTTVRNRGGVSQRWPRAWREPHRGSAWAALSVRWSPIRYSKVSVRPDWSGRGPQPVQCGRVRPAGVPRHETRQAHGCRERGEGADNGPVTDQRSLPGERWALRASKSTGNPHEAKRFGRERPFRRA